MPAVSKKQRRAMAIAEKHPEELYERNKGLRKMTKKQLHDFAATKEKRLPEEVKEKHMARKEQRKEERRKRMKARMEKRKGKK